MMNARRLLSLTAAVIMAAFTAHAEGESRLAVATGQPGSDSFAFGTGLWAMSQIALMPAHGLALAAKEVADDQDRLALLQDREVDAALVYGRVPPAYENDARSIMALWPRGISSDDADPVQFLVHKDVPADVVYLITKATFEHANYFRAAHASLGLGLPSEAMTGLDLPLHEGAYRYYRENGFGQDAAVAVDDQTGATNGQAEAAAAVTYRDFDDAALGQVEIDQVAAACRHALELGLLSAVLGDLAHTGCEVYQDRLQDTGEPNGPGPRSASALATPVEAAPRGDAANEPFETPVGQGGPAIHLAPKTGEASTDAAAEPAPQPNRKARQPTM